jgi:thiosulfate/3-mercaptopyruvate sulfurtransferase
MNRLKSSLVTVEWLYKNLDIPDLVILDASIPKITALEPAVDLPPIVGARFFDIRNKFSDPEAPFPNTVPDLTQFNKQAQKLGINNNSTIVVYDDKGIYSSARCWWLFKAFGFENIAVLDGGLPQWLAANYPVAQKFDDVEPKPGNFSGQYDPDFFVFFDEIKQIQNLESHLILDARTQQRFKGLVKEPREGLRSGNIPNSKNIPYTSLMDGYKLKSQEKLKQIFKDNGIENKKLVFTCGSGVTACVLALAAERIGISDFAVYDGSWTEYGSLTA